MADVRITTEIEGLDQVNRSLNKLSGRFDDAGQKSAQASRGIGRFREGLGRIRSSIGPVVVGLGRMAGIVGGLAVAGGAGLAALGKRALQTGDELKNTADRVGLSVEAFQELRFAAQQSGVDAGRFTDSVSRLNRRLGLFIQDGGGPAAKAFEELGIAAEIQSGKLQGTEDVFAAIVRQLENIEDPARTAALASQFFGEEAGPALANLLTKGTEGVTALRDRARELGVVISDDAATAARDANDAFGRVAELLSGQLTQAFLKLTPQFLELAETIERNAPEIQKFAEILGRTLIEAIKLAVRGIDGLIEVFDVAVRTFNTVTDAVQGMVGAISRQFDRLGGIVDSVGSFLGRMTGLWQQHSDEVVGQSIVPDMIDRIGAHFQRLPGEMGRPTSEAVGQIESAFRAAGEQFDLFRKAIPPELVDIQVQAQVVARGMHGAFQRFFFDTLKGADDFRQVMKALFANIADVVLAEFARIAASQVFRVLFGTGGGGGAALGAARGVGGDIIAGGGIIGSGGQIEAGTGLAAGGGLSGLLGGGLAIGSILQGVIEKDIGKTLSSFVGASLGLVVGGPLGAALGGVLGNFFGGLFQTGGSRVFNRPALIGVGETGAERVTVEPLGGFAGRGSGGHVIVNFQGPTVVDEVSMRRFERRIARAVAAQQARVV